MPQNSDKRVLASRVDEAMKALVSGQEVPEGLASFQSLVGNSWSATADNIRQEQKFANLRDGRGAAFMGWPQSAIDFIHKTFPNIRSDKPKILPSDQAERLVRKLVEIRLRG